MVSKDELNRIYKYRNNKIKQWVFLLAVVIMLLGIMISYLTKEFMNNISIEIIWDILFVVCFSKKKHCIKIREVFTEQTEEKERTVGEAVLSLFLLVTKRL